MKGPRARKASYDDSKQPHFFRREVWLSSSLSLARFSGAVLFNGARYEVDEVTEDLCRLDVVMERRAAYTAEQKAKVAAKTFIKNRYSSTQRPFDLGNASSN